eukprot:TRINITY_DN8024_c0_g1_i1.p1 TRINITY_DN8024_c0_g1~~TRINITY_DN8024_c0_g1_i1.p1  ORF type:complete len:221 (-),score=23.01 TRINITY_DN8024_c0_g1_i1:136-798(-)
MTTIIGIVNVFARPNEPENYEAIRQFIRTAGLPDWTLICTDLYDNSSHLECSNCSEKDIVSMISDLMEILRFLNKSGGAYAVGCHRLQFDGDGYSGHVWFSTNETAIAENPTVDDCSVVIDGNELDGGSDAVRKRLVIFHQESIKDVWVDNYWQLAVASPWTEGGVDAPALVTAMQAADLQHYRHVYLGRFVLLVFTEKITVAAARELVTIAELVERFSV